MTEECKIEQLKIDIEQSKKIVFFGGAGVSTESGIPDFRSKDGLYNTPNVGFEHYTPEYLLSKNCLKKEPNVFFEFYRQKLDTRSVKPNITHYWLADLEKQGKLSAIITQNIDGLHQLAGSKNVIELHGTTQENYCCKCKMQYHKDFIFNTKEKVPHCECGGVIRPNITLYGEQLPDGAFDRANDYVMNSDLIIVAGTSLSVYPAASLISEHVHSFSKLVVINREIIGNLPSDTLFIQDSLGNVIKQIAL